MPAQFHPSATDPSTSFATAKVLEQSLPSQHQKNQQQNAEEKDYGIAFSHYKGERLEVTPGLT